MCGQMPVPLRINLSRHRYRKIAYYRSLIDIPVYIDVLLVDIIHYKSILVALRDLTTCNLTICQLQIAVTRLRIS